MEITCKQCGKTIETVDKRKRFCDDNCRTLYYNNWRKEHSAKLREQYTKADKAHFNELQKDLRNRKKRSAYTRIAREIIKIDNEDTLVEYLLKTFTGVNKNTIDN